MQRSSAIVVLALVVGAAASPASAQLRASEAAAVTQTVDGTTISVEYSRPQARGRTRLFGSQVPWGEVWTPGANDATVLDLSADVRIDGHPVPAGRWSLWLEVRPAGPWTLVLDPRDSLYHTAHPEPTEDQIRFPVTTSRGPFMELLTWSFPEVRADGARLVLGWEERRLGLDIVVEPSRPRVVGAAVAEPYLGEWTFRFDGPPGEGAPPPPPPTPLTFRHHPDGRLVGTMALPGPTGEENTEMLLMPVAEGIFEIGFLEKGELREMPGLFMEFEPLEGTPARYLVRDVEDAIVARGERVPPPGAPERAPHSTRTP